jgi:hypothetical protein
MSDEPLEDLVRDGKSLEFQIVSTEPNPTYTWAAVRAVAAGARVNSFVDLTREVSRNWASHVLLKVDRAGQPRLDFPGLRAEQIAVENRASILASEVLHHARAALDLSVHLASWRDTGTPNQHSQFPLAETQRQWSDALRGRWLEGLSATHRDWIRAVQPFEGVEWSGQLRRLSNQDKHRVTVQVAVAYSVTVEDWTVAPDPPGSDDLGTLEPSRRELSFLIRNALEPSSALDPYLPATNVLLGVMHGTVALVNQFLVDEGNNEITATVSQSAS